MFGRHSAVRVSLVSVAAAVLAACTGAPLSPPQPATFQDLTAQLAVRQAPAGENARRDLLYVSNGPSVYFFSYPQIDLKGKIAKVYGGALCADRNGDVFVGEFYAKSIVEYAHGRTTPIAMLSTGYGAPDACSVDPRTGNLAAINNFREGIVSVFVHASGDPVTYANPKINSYDSCTYDDRGNLYLDGWRMDGRVAFDELPYGSKTFTKIALDRNIHWAGGMAWNHDRLAVADLGRSGNNTVVHEFAIHGNLGTETGTTSLDGSLDVNAFAIDGQRIIGADTGREGGNAVRLWRYPGGGSPTRIVPKLGAPAGVALSKAP